MPDVVSPQYIFKLKSSKSVFVATRSLGCHDCDKWRRTCSSFLSSWVVTLTSLARSTWLQQLRRKTRNSSCSCSCSSISCSTDKFFVYVCKLGNEECQSGFRETRNPYSTTRLQSGVCDLVRLWSNFSTTEFSPRFLRLISFSGHWLFGHLIAPYLFAEPPRCVKLNRLARIKAVWPDRRSRCCVRAKPPKKLLMRS